jgi:5-methyltetrahydrofolate--homocysteine methyltransferase
VTLRKSEAAERLRAEAAQRILLTDGAFGTMIQSYHLKEADYAGGLGLQRDQKGNNDLLVLTRPEIITEITEAYLDAGSDIVSTNTFNANTISQGDYDAEHLVTDMNHAAARIARDAANEWEARDGRPRFVAGAIGPTNKTLSLSPDVNDPGFRAIDFDTMKDVYADQTRALLDGGCDFILIETIFDTLNAKSAIMAAIEVGEERGIEVPLMISMTITDMSGRNLSGHSVEAFWHTVRHARPLTIGLNCAFGASIRTRASPTISASMTSSRRRRESSSANGRRTASSTSSGDAAARRRGISRRWRMRCGASRRGRSRSRRC